MADIYYNGEKISQLDERPVQKKVQKRKSNGEYSSVRERIQTFMERIGRLVLGGAVIGLVIQSTLYPLFVDFLFIPMEASAYASAPQPTNFPVLDRIGDCESGTGKKDSRKQFLPNGNVVTHTNTNGSVDVGMYQINLTASHINLMAKKGFNPLTLEGNKAMAEYIYLNEGTSAWNSSSKCWK